MSYLAIALTIVAVALFGAFVLLGAWIDGRRQKVLEAGKHPVTTPDGNVEAQETQEQPHGTGHDTAARDIH